MMKGYLTVMDMLYDIETGELTDSHDAIPHTSTLNLLTPIFIKGRQVYAEESLPNIRKRAIRNVTDFIKTHGNNVYPVRLEKKFHQLKEQLILDKKS